ncbi:MAG TPA: tRNA (guanosine(37)-N1)-methyltransferase TrmD [Gammaproteobacteria bacterium]|nr:tRNA (guanosine(37)-N1)-methyltransferase TrmD [Gammaproteobacteria bacterium]
MRIDVVTLFPEMFDALVGHGVTGKAVKRGLLQFDTWNPRDYAVDRHRTVDDRPYGGGPGMLMMVQPLRDAIHAAKSASKEQSTVIYLSPQGRTLDQVGVESLVKKKSITFVAGRYEGIDERLIAAEVDEEWSVGDYVLSGGELAAMVMIDAMIRLLPGALGHAESSEQDSFTNHLLDCPHYTRPEFVDGRQVPAVLLSGDHQAIERWRKKQSLGRTWQRRPDLLEKAVLDSEMQLLLEEFKQEVEN